MDRGMQQQTEQNQTPFDHSIHYNELDYTTALHNNQLQ